MDPQSFLIAAAGLRGAQSDAFLSGTRGQLNPNLCVQSADYSRCANAYYSLQYFEQIKPTQRSYLILPIHAFGTCSMIPIIAMLKPPH